MLTPVLFSIFLTSYALENWLFRSLQLTHSSLGFPWSASYNHISVDQTLFIALGIHMIVIGLFMLFLIKSLDGLAKMVSLACLVQLIELGLLQSSWFTGEIQFAIQLSQVRSKLGLFMGVSLCVFYMVKGISAVVFVGRDGRQKVAKIVKEE